MRRIPTAPLAALSFLVAWAAVDASGSRTLGGLVLLAGAVALGIVWRIRHGRGVALRLLALGLLGFVVSHALGLLIGAWPAVIAVAAGMAWATWRLADARAPRAGAGGPPRERAAVAAEPGPHGA